MKKAIEKAIENGWDIESFFNQILIKKGLKVTTYEWRELGFKLFIEYKYEDRTAHVFICIFRLLFGSNFLECLVGIGSCSDGKTPALGISDNCNHGLILYGKNIPCQDCSLLNDTEFHLKEMALLKDVDKLKEYVEGLV